MTKQVRFVALAKGCGKPETATLWNKPEHNPPFMKAVRENRVMTVVQNPTGSHVAEGEIGFHQKPSALYFVFPKPLPKTDARVIGIKFDLIEENSAKESLQKVPLAKKAAKPHRISLPVTPEPKTPAVDRPKPVPLKKFSVTVLRIARMEVKSPCQR